MLTRKTLAVLGALSLTVPSLAQNTPIYRNPKAPIEARLKDLMGRLTPDEKISLISGAGITTQAVPRLGIPRMPMANAGEGVRGGEESTNGPASLFPAGVNMASSWDTDLIGRIGQAIGAEALNKGTGVNVLLGPDVNIHRSPLAGRNGEAMSEDPFLTARMAVTYIEGMQSTGCAASIKHYACNNEEVDRDDVNVLVSERALREIYLPAFEASVKEAKVWTVMSSYNQVNGHHASANHYLLTDILRGDWGYDGMVMSDWGGVHETAGTLNAGNDLEMPGGQFLTKERVQAAMNRGEIKQATIDESVRRILRTELRVGLLDGPHTPDHSVVNSPAHQRLTYEAACKSIVLLKNQGGILPMNAKTLKSIAVIGPGVEGMEYGALGSVSVGPFYQISPLEGIQKRVGSSIPVHFAPGVAQRHVIPASAVTPGQGTGQGWRAEYFGNRDFSGEPALVRTDPEIRFNWTSGPVPSVAHEDFSVRWTGKLTAPATGRYTLTMTADDGCRVFLDGKPVIDHWILSGATPVSANVDLVAGRSYDVRVEYFQGTGSASARLEWKVPGPGPFEEAVRAARESDVAVVVVTTGETEGEAIDRPSMELPLNQSALIQAVAAVNPRTIVVLNNGGAVDMRPWLSRVPGLIEAWYPGQEGGHALASILFGDVNPSGKLPDTLAVRREDYPDYGNFPGKNGVVRYAEGIYVGYRHFDKKQIAPFFPFGYGLSYTTFRYGKPALSKPVMDPNGSVTVSIPVTNTGKRAGAEVVELYIHDPRPKVDKPVRELKGFSRVDLKPGETKMVRMTLTPRSLAWCDVAGRQWKADAGRYDVEIGASSRDIRQRASVRLSRTFTQALPHMRASAD